MLEQICYHEIHLSVNIVIKREAETHMLTPTGVP